ncbi:MULTISPECIES: FHA domain-containing protein [Nesterenkonia]|uniref:PSer/pThr/pTyr-binding forkhead associated (FHA) protein n=1 Tax=Nesterenkonia xinjiangensis TaxID=225327 RepID=A0A7Z0GIG9_9MICC|nr:FHA domain-containing protein [Nesterenkonia sp. HG001]MDZ5078577.1 FHA domain-containing protein [Nesterenkonia sp. HG001]NYJ76605.1 pSer/pThr/pTyr-binding forkhead associated (FHA) protein [Nesterenkonia xinjiangensis]
MSTTPGAPDERENIAETTSISLPPADASAAQPRLTEDDREAIAALPQGSALLMAHSGANQGARFLLDKDVTTVGRHPEAEILLDDVTVSRRHLTFSRVDGGFELEDLGSLNGTYVNHDRVDRYTLRAGDEVQIGKFRLTYYAGSK